MSEESLRRSAPWGAKIKQIAQMYWSFAPDEYALAIWEPGSGNTPYTGFPQGTTDNSGGRKLSTVPSTETEVPGTAGAPGRAHLKVLHYNARIYGDDLHSIVRGSPYSARTPIGRQNRNGTDAMPRNECGT